MTSKPPSIPMHALERSPHFLRRLARRGPAVIFVVAVLSHLPGLNHRYLNYHEVLYAQPAREMLQTGDWLQPRFGGVKCNQKPPLTTWIVAGAMWTLGEREWAVRLPSVLAAGAFCALATALAARLLDPLSGCCTGLAVASSFFLLRQAHTAEADVFLCLAVATAMYAFAAGALPGASPRWTRWGPLAFYLANAASFLIKGPIGVVMALGAALAYAAIRREGAVWRFLCNGWGIAAFVLVAGAWPMAAWLRDPSIFDDWRFHHWDRFRGGLGRKDPGYYLYTLPAVLLPWTPLTILGLWRMVKRKAWRDPRFQWFVCWVVPGLLVISLCAFKRKHYGAPLWLPLMIPAGIELRRLLFRGRHRRLAWGGLTCLWLALAGGTWFAHDDFAMNSRFALRVQQRLPKEQTVWLVHLPENQVAYYLNRPLVRADYGSDCRDLVKTAGPNAYLVAPRRLLPRFQAVTSLECLEAAPPGSHPEDDLVFLRLSSATAPGADQRSASQLRAHGAGIL